MRSFFFLVILTIGVGVGLLVALREDWGTRLVMMALGAVVAAPIGAVLTGVAQRRSGSRRGWGGSVKPVGSLFRSDHPIRRWDR